MQGSLHTLDGFGVAARHVRDLTDVHHTTLLAAMDGRQPSSGPVSDLLTYMQRAAELQRVDGLFEKVEIELNVGCNRRCTYCNLSSDRRENYVKSRQNRMEWRLFDLLIGQLEDLRFAGILCYHFYAEPLLNKKLSCYAAHARDRLPAARCIIYTNGDYLTLERYHELTDAGISLFFVTRHDNLIPDFLEPVLRQPNVMLDTRADMVLNNRAGLLGSPVDGRVRTLPCIFTSEALVVTIDGNVLPCSCDFRESLCFGNISDVHIRDIYLSDSCRQFRRDLLAGRREKYALCRNCDFYCEVMGILSSAEPHRLRVQPILVQLQREFMVGRHSK